MKKITVLIIVLISFSCLFAQSKSLKFGDIRVGPFFGNYSKRINVENGDTVYYVYLSFQNAKYKAIADIHSISFLKQEQLDSFISDLKSAVIAVDKKTSKSWYKDAYIIFTSDSLKKIFINESPAKGDGYTILSKKNAKELLEKLEYIKNINVGCE